MRSLWHNSSSYLIGSGQNIAQATTISNLVQQAPLRISSNVVPQMTQASPQSVPLQNNHTIQNHPRGSYTHNMSFTAANLGGIPPNPINGQSSSQTPIQQNLDSFSSAIKAIQIHSSSTNKPPIPPAKEMMNSPGIKPQTITQPLGQIPAYQGNTTNPDYNPPIQQYARTDSRASSGAVMMRTSGINSSTSMTGTLQAATSTQNFNHHQTASFSNVSSSMSPIRIQSNVGQASNNVPREQQQPGMQRTGSSQFNVNGTQGSSQTGSFINTGMRTEDSTPLKTGGIMISSRNLQTGQIIETANISAIKKMIPNDSPTRLYSQGQNPAHDSHQITNNGGSNGLTSTLATTTFVTK